MERLETSAKFGKLPIAVFVVALPIFLTQPEIRSQFGSVFVVIVIILRSLQSLFPKVQHGQSVHNTS